MEPYRRYFYNQDENICIHLDNVISSYLYLCGFYRIAWAIANIRCCPEIWLRANKMGGTAAAVKARVKGLQMGVKTETPAKVNPARSALTVIKGWSLIQAQGPLSLVEQWWGWWSPISKAHVWDKPFEQTGGLALITAVIAEVLGRAAGWRDELCKHTLLSGLLDHIPPPSSTHPSLRASSVTPPSLLWAPASHVIKLKPRI